MTSFFRQGKKGDRLAAEKYGLSLPPWRSGYEFLYPEAKAVLEKLHRKYRLGIIANQNPGTEERLMKFGIDGYFELILASAEEGIAKPDSEIFLRALCRAKCSPENAAMIGDRLDNDIAPANRLGITTVRVLTGFAQYAQPACDEEIPSYTVTGLYGLFDIFT